MTDETRRAAIIGTGAIADAHVVALREAGERVKLVAAVDIDAERLRAFSTEKEIPQTYANAVDMLDAVKPDLVLIATPSSTHCELSVLSMEAGAWVLCEKPLCGSLAEMDRIEEAEKRTGNYCSSVFQWRFGSGGQHLKRLIESEEMGRILVCNSLVTWYRTPAYYAVPWRGRWETELGGTSMTLGIHAMDFVLWLLGEWQEVRAMIGRLDRDIEVENVSMASVRFANGAMANLTNSALSPRESSYLRFDFQRATVELSHLYRYANEDWRYTVLKDAPCGEEQPAWGEIPEERPSSHGTQLSAFLDSMDRGCRPAVSGLDVRGTIEFLTSLYKSGMTGLAVSQGSIGAGDPFYHSMCGPGGQRWQSPN